MILEEAKARAAGNVRNAMYQKTHRPEFTWNELGNITIWWDYAELAVEAAMESLLEAGFRFSGDTNGVL